MRLLFIGLITVSVCIAGVSAGPAAATQTHAPTAGIPLGTPLKYHCQWTQRMRHAAPWTGDMTIKDNAEGIINGTYRSTSIKPDPFYGKIVAVTGAVTGKSIRLSFGIVPSVTVRGEIVKGGIQGTSMFNSGTLEFAAAGPLKSH